MDKDNTEYLQSPWHLAVYSILFKGNEKEERLNHNLARWFFLAYKNPRELAEANVDSILKINNPHGLVLPGREQLEKAVEFSKDWIAGKSVNELFKIDIPEKEADNVRVR